MIVEVAVGVTTHHGKAQVTVNDYQNIVTTWEQIDSSGLGTSVIVPYDNAVQYVHLQSKTPDRSHGVVVTTTDADGRLTYYAGFAWQKAGEITSLNEWQSYTKRFADEKFPEQPLTSDSVKALTKKVADWQINHHEEQGKYRAIPRTPLTGLIVSVTTTLNGITAPFMQGWIAGVKLLTTPNTPSG